MHEKPDLVFKSVCLFNMNPANVGCSESTIGKKFETCSQFSLNKDTITTPLRLF